MRAHVLRCGSGRSTKSATLKTYAPANRLRSNKRGALTRSVQTNLLPSGENAACVMRVVVAVGQRVELPGARCRRGVTIQ